MHQNRILAFVLLGIIGIGITTVKAENEATIPKYIQNISKIGLRSPIKLPIFYDDASMLRFVSRTTPLSEKTYAPDDLVSISGALINQAGRNSVLRLGARNALWEMAGAFKKEFGLPLTVVSGYRSAAYQQRLWDLGRCTDSLCAPPGYSEHQLGFAVDLFDASTEKEFATNPTLRKYVAWLKDNAHLYGWTQSYQKGIEIDEYEVEPWHYRYVGIHLATRLHNLGWTYTEFVRFQEDIQRR
ncbi:M15 family metallopeptidase [Candidatus Gracilibacteria bacterium]|nr:M15 family metallopeptidase [Candidatus Gracilibacteria bacterium]